VSLLDPPLNIASNSISWNLNTEIVTADQPVRMVHRQQQLTASANRGRTDLKKNVYLTVTPTLWGSVVNPLKQTS
jgi:hypothetical protein